MALRSGQITVATAGTAVAGPVLPKGNKFALKAHPSNTGVAWVGNDGADDVAAANGYPLAVGEQIIIDTSIASLQRVNLTGIRFDVTTSGDIVCWFLVG